MKLRKFQALSILGEQGGCQRAFLLSVFLADAARRFLDKFLAWRATFAPVVRVPRLWQQGMHEIEKVSGSGSRACMKLWKSQALAAGHA